MVKSEQDQKEEQSGRFGTNSYLCTNPERSRDLSSNTSEVPPTHSTYDNIVVCS